MPLLRKPTELLSRSRLGADAASTAAPAPTRCVGNGVRYVVSAFASFLALVAPAAAQLPIAKLTVVSPAGGKAGESVEVVGAGEHLEGLTALHFSRPGIAAARTGDNKFKVTIPPDAPAGLVDVRAIGTWGISNPRRFHVAQLRELPEKEPNGPSGSAQTFALDGIVNGVLDRRADVDEYALPLAAGTKVAVECFALQIDSRLEAVVTLFDPSGRQVARERAYQQDDPRIYFVAERAGVYRIQVHDLTYNGGEGYFYRLAVHARPVVEYGYPPAVWPGGATAVTWFGFNLRGGLASTSVLVAGRPLDAVTDTVDGGTAGAAAAEAPPTGVMLRPMALPVNGIALPLRPAPAATRPAWLALARHPLVTEVEPNDTEASAQKVTVPCEIAGRCDRPGDRDWFRFTAQKGSELAIEAVSERSGFPTDLVFQLRRLLPPAPNQPSGVARTEDVGEFDDDTANVGRKKFDTSSHDPVARLEPPADGEYLLEVRDRYSESRGDGRFVYRVRVGPRRPDFRLAVTPVDEVNPASVLVRQGGTTSAQVFAMRRGGFDGEISITARGLPTGVSAPSVTLGPGRNEAPLVLLAEPNAPDFAGPIEIIGSGTIDGKAVTRSARAGVIIWTDGGSGPKPCRLADQFCLAVRPGAPYRLTATPAESTIAQGSLITFALRLDRLRKDFAGKLTGVTALYLPPNVTNQTVEIGDRQTEGILHLHFKNDAPVGSFTFLIQGTGQVPFSKSPDPKAAKANVAVAEPTPPLRVTVLPRPVELKVSQNVVTLKPGQSTPIKVTVRRVNGYSGPVALRWTSPPGVTGLSAPDVEVSANANEGTLTLTAAANAGRGDKPFCTVRAGCIVNNRPLSVDALVTVKIQ